MSGAIAIFLGLLLGAIGALLHLVIVRRRATLATSGRMGLAIATYPLGLLPLGGCILLAAAIHPWAAWATLFGVVIGRILGLRRLGGLP